MSHRTLKAIHRAYRDDIGISRRDVPIAVEGEHVTQFNLAELRDHGDVVELEATENSFILFGHADPIHEPIASRGPFVMNTQAELNQAFADIKAGNFNVSAT